MPMTPEEKKEFDDLKKENEELKKQLESSKNQPAPSNQIDDAKKQGAADERNRILALDDIAIPGFEAITASAKKDGKTVQETALALLKAQKERGVSMAAINADSKVVPVMHAQTDDEEQRRQYAKTIADEAARMKAKK